MYPFLGQVTLAAFDFAPYGWAQCTGQIMSISQNTALFSLLGTYYGGDGKSNFALPNLQGNCAVGVGQGPGLSLYSVGETGGTQTVTLLTTEVPSHSHSVVAHVGRGDEQVPTNNSFAQSAAGDIYTTTAPASPVTMSQSSLSGPAGGNLPHNNMMPYLTLNWIIALQGVFPARS